MLGTTRHRRIGAVLTISKLNYAARFYERPNPIGLNRITSMLALTEADADKTIDVAAGDTVEIQLPENATTGYRWTLETIDKSVCKVIADERHGPDKVIPGAPGVAAEGGCHVRKGARRHARLPTRPYVVQSCRIKTYW